MEEKKLIFVACGQKEEKEINLGKKIEELINKKEDFEAFLAESAHDLDSLTSNIFKNLNICSGFIAILHVRGKKENGEFLTSLWINQEIGIASFVRHIEGKEIPVIIFKEKGIEDDGILKYIHANPIEFEKDEEILSQIEKWLSPSKFMLIRRTDLKIEQYSTIKLLESSQSRHVYKLTLTVQNVGIRTIKGITFDLEFPSNIPILSDLSIFKNIGPGRVNEDNILFEDVIRKFPDILPGRGFTFACFDFEINRQVYSNRLTKKNIVYTFYADDMYPHEKKDLLEGKNIDGTDRVNF